MSQLPELTQREGLLTIALLLQSIAMDGSIEDVNAAIKNTCDLDDELIKKYWENARALVFNQEQNLSR